MNPQKLRTRFFAASLLSALALPFLAHANTPSMPSVIVPEQQAEPKRMDPLHLYVGEARVLRLPAMPVKTAIGNGKIVSTAMVSKTEMLLIAQDAGRSTLTLWLQNGAQLHYAVEVGLNSPSQIYDHVRALLGPEKNLRVSLVGNRVFLQSETLKAPQVRLIEALQKAFPDQIMLVSGGDVALEERTVYVQAQLVEIKKSALEELGIDWDDITDGPRFSVSGETAYERHGPRGVTQPFGATLGIASVITSRIHILQQKGDAYVIAAPRLTARCGGKANFTSGGELPIPIVSGLGQTTVEYKDYGIRLAIEPVCDRLGNIRAKVAAEVSDIDPSVTVLGAPGLLTRKAESELDLIEGRTMLLSGLSAVSAGVNDDQVPYLGNLPLLGNLFRHRHKDGERSELLLLITPNFITADSPSVHDSMRRHDQFTGEAERSLHDQDVTPFQEPAPKTAPAPEAAPAPESEPAAQERSAAPDSLGTLKAMGWHAQD